MPRLVRRPTQTRAARAAATAVAIAVAACLALTGCATHQQQPSPPSSSAAAFPVTVTPPDGKRFTMATKPERIVSLSAADTEILFAVGAGKQVVAVDSQSDYPPQAPRTQLSGLQPNPEAIAKYHPDLVVADGDYGGLVKNMNKVHIPVLLVPAAKNVDKAYQEWKLLGKVTGHAAKADGVVENARAQLTKIVARAKQQSNGKQLTYYHELGPKLYTATSKTFVGSVYAKFGLRNIADPADTAAAGGYPQLSAEQILHANPDLIFLADTKCCAQSLATVSARPGWKTLTAVRDGDVIKLNDDIASRWGPRIVDFARKVADAVTKARAQQH